MLILSRSVDQRIRIGNEIFLTVVRIHGNRVEIGIEAPQEVRVVRDEVELKPKDKGE
ncbi:MAG TPA: carbon storage regulator [Pirellulales bacterium]|nr:carbon storage regulator [Pirellulales bacterium]